MEEPIGRLDGGGLRHITPYLPPWSANGNIPLRMWEESFVDRMNNRAIITKVEYKDKKGKLHEMVAFVKWIN